MTNEQKQKLKDMFAEYDRTQKTNVTMGALQTLAQYWVENESIIERAAKQEVEINGPNWIPQSWDDPDAFAEWQYERDSAREMHDKTLIPMHRYSCIVMLYTTIERELKRLVENLQKELGPQKLKWTDIRPNSTLEQISKFCDAFYGLRLVDCANYEALNDLRKVRNCIVHNHGDMSLSSEKEKDFLFNLKGKRNDFFAHPNGDIYVGGECIKQFIQEIWNFFTSVFGTLKWEIALHWQGDKLGKVFKGLKVK